MNIKITKIILLMLTFASGFLIAKPRSDMFDKSPYLQFGDNPFSQNSVSVIKTQIRFDANNIDTWVQNTGTFDLDIRTPNTPGFMWPKGQNRFAIFTAGLSIGTYYNNSLRLATASYNGEYAPGYILNGVPMTDSRFHIYSVKSGDNASTNPDYANWGNMVPFGAPYVDVNNNGIYDSGDIPGIKNADQTIFICLTDGFPENHSQSEGFSGGTEPIFAEVHLTLWCYNTQGLDNIQFINWVVINKSNVDWTRTHFSVVVDPDLGDPNDDFIGCDTSSSNKDMAYCYNADNVDGTGNPPPSYGTPPPASGMDFFKSPDIFTGNPNDSVVSYFPPGSNNKIVKRGYKPLGLTSFVYFNRGGTPTCETDPSLPIQAYRYMTGIKKDGTIWLHPANLQQTKFCFPGDPITISGWSERGTDGNTSQGGVDNCNGALTGNVYARVPGDRRFIFNSGDSLFTIAPGDTQNIVVGQFVAKGNSNLNSIKLLKEVDHIAQALFNANFAINPPPPSPQVKVSVNEVSSNIGTASITMSWGNISESYLLWDSLLQVPEDTSYLKFEGYQIFEISRFAGNLPDFNQPQTINNSIHLLRIFDIVDTIGVIIDTLPTGILVNGEEQFGPFPVVPFYTAPITEGFPNTGIYRNITISSTTYPDEHNGRTELIYDQPYKFAVIAYAYRTNPKSKNVRKTILSPIGSNIITVVPRAPLAGSNFTLKNGDTLFTNRRDLGLMPIIKDQQSILNAKYRIVFQSPDTTYNVLRSTDGGSSYQTIKSRQFISNGIPGQTNPDDSSKIFDGILMKVQRIYDFNAGVISDPGKPDSSQTRLKGWEYLPERNAYLTKSDTTISAFPYQSRSMNISWPTPTTFTGLGTTVLKEELRKIKIQFTGYGNGQKAYRYLNRSLLPPADPTFAPFIISTGAGFRYQDIREVPFKVFEIEELDSSSTPRQLNCAFLENNDSLVINKVVGGQLIQDTVGWGWVNGKWEPTAAKSGGFEILYIFNSSYDTNIANYKTRNLRINQTQFDIMYVWAPKKISKGANFQNGDEFIIYPYTVTRPDIVAGFPLYYEFEAKAPLIGNSELAISQNDMDKIRVVPNPFYGFNDLQTTTSNRFITFRRLPRKCSIKIYSLSGNLVEKLEKDNDDSSLNWDLKNFSDVPVASGIFIALIEAPGIGNKTIKLAIFTSEERIDF